MMKLEYKIDKRTPYTNIKEILKQEFHVSDRLLKKLKKHHQIYLNHLPVAINHKINNNDLVSILLDFEEESENIIPTKMELNILYEDDALLAINKPAGIPVHPSMNHYTDSLSNGVIAYFHQIGLHRKIRIVNRLDKNTSGIVIFAKNEYVQETFISQMKANIFKKEYLALVDGIVEKDTGTIDAPITRKENSIIERQVSLIGQSAITHYQVIQRYDYYSLVQFILETGRTHQIRVHCAHIHHPILGDALYGRTSSLIIRQALHAYKVNFIHPISHQKLEIIATLPNDMKRLIENQKR